MARRRLAGEVRSREILDASLGLFARQGFSGTTTRSIARAAGVSEALVFKHFPHKRSLYRAILKSKIRDAERSLPLDESLQALDDETFLVRIATHVMRRVEEDDTFLRLLLHSALEGHELAVNFQRARVEKILAAIEERIRRRHARRGRKETLEPALAARAFNGMIFASVLSRQIFREPVLSRVSAERWARTIVRIFLHGIGPRREAP